MDYISLYLKYTQGNECPTFFHRWSALTSLGAFLGRRVHFKFGHIKIHPNMYVMLLGNPGTKKSTGIKIGAKLIEEVGFSKFSAKRTRQEKFLEDLAGQDDETAELEEQLSQMDINLFGDSQDKQFAKNKPPAECFVAADEFNNFIGYGNMDFISVLGELWDYDGVYDHALKGSKSVYINDPTINILSGNTPTGFTSAFPPEAIGQGFFSRLILVYGKPCRPKIAFPEQPNQELREQLLAYLVAVSQKIRGEIKLTDEAREAMEDIYVNWKELPDPRFEHYSSRRQQHLIKLCMLVAVSHLRTNITLDDVIEANSLLSFTEKLMPKALGEFGRSRNSMAIHKIMTFVASQGAVTFKQIFKVVCQDFDKRDHVYEAIENLVDADKLCRETKKAENGNPATTLFYIPAGDIGNNEKYINWDVLTEEERSLL